MSKLFEDTGDKNARKFQCFVCGVNHDDIQKMKDHVIETHEEGREYILCPECKFPVRCLKTHFKVKHPARTMPKGVQTRVSIWRDFSSNGKKKKTTKKVSFRTGSFTSRKSGCDIPYRSGMECEFYELLESDHDVSAFFAEPFRVPYYYQNSWHDYIPDIRVNFVDGTTEIWEIKPANQTAYEQNRAKWGAMNDHALNHGWQFSVQTEVGLGKLKAKIKKQQE
jgi:hypothetical protein